MNCLVFVGIYDSVHKCFPLGFTDLSHHILGTHGIHVIRQHSPLIIVTIKETVLLFTIQKALKRLLHGQFRRGTGIGSRELVGKNGRNGKGHLKTASVIQIIHDKGLYFLCPLNMLVIASLGAASHRKHIRVITM